MTSASSDDRQPLVLAHASGDDLVSVEAPEPKHQPGLSRHLESNEEAAITQPAVDSQRVSTTKVAFGITLVIVAGFAFTASNVIQKFYVPTLTFWQLLLHRAVVQSALMLMLTTLAAVRARLSVAETLLGPHGVRRRTIAQGLMGGVLLLCMYNAIKEVPLGNCSVIMFCTPIFTFFFAPCMLGERFGLFRTVVTVFMLGGVILITRPPFLYGPDTSEPAGNSTTPAVTDLNEDSLVMIGYVCAAAVPLLAAIISILTRQCKHVPVPLLMFWFGAGALIVSLIAVGTFQPGHLIDLTNIEWLSTAVIIALGLFGNMCYTLAVRWVSPSKANVFRSFEVILNFVLQLHFEHTVFHAENAIGIVLLVLSVVIMAYEKEVMLKFSHWSFL